MNVLKFCLSSAGDAVGFSGKGTAGKSLPTPFPCFSSSASREPQQDCFIFDSQRTGNLFSVLFARRHGLFLLSA